jgi:hypothetical protein
MTKWSRRNICLSLSSTHPSKSTSRVLETKYFPVSPKKYGNYLARETEILDRKQYD